MKWMFTMLDISIGKPANLAFMFDDKFLTSKDAIIKDFTISMEASPIEMHDGMGFRKYIQTSPYYTLDLQIISSHCNLEEILTQNRIRDKRVEDCTIHELIIAINNKI